MTDSITIDPRFHGPSGSGHGGYVCGVLAELLGGPAEVTLRKPPPLGRPLRVVRLGSGLQIRDGDAIVAEAAPGKLEADVPEPVTLQEAETASAAFPGFVTHPFPTCFVCGPAASKDVGLRVFPGPVADRGLVAAPWRPPTWLTGEGGGIDPRVVWAVLDCPGGWAVIPAAGPSVLGRMTASLLAPVLPKDRLVLLGWARGAEGRKLYAGSALFTQAGELLAAAVATWLRLEHRGSGQ